KTDRLDAVWLCKVAERQMLRPSFVPPGDIRRLRDLTRYRIDLVGVRNAEKNRAAQLCRSFRIVLDNLSWRPMPSRSSVQDMTATALREVSPAETVPTVPHWINGSLYPSTSGRTAPVCDPALGVVTKHVALTALSS